MNKIRHLFIICVIGFLCTFNSHAFAQLGLRKGIKVGYNWASLSDNELTGVESKKAMTGGISLEFNLLRLLSMQVDILYSPRGAARTNDGKTNINYLSIPVVLKRKFFPVGMHPYILAGPEISFLLSAKTDDEDIKDSINSEDLTLVAGVGLEFSLIGKSTYFEGRYCYGLNNIYKNTDFASAKNRVYQIFIGILL